jgi:heat shock protein 1/8
MSETKDAASNDAVCVGIDLGTTYSCVGVWEQDRVEIIANDQGNRTTPSYVAFGEDGERLIGDGAKNQAAINPYNTIFDAKRLIGRNFSDTSVRRDSKNWPFKVVADDRDRPYVEVQFNGETRKFSPEEISSMVLIKMKQTAESHLGRDVTKAVVTVPAYFNDQQRQATKDAGRLAGLDVLRIINEPTAAAIAYGLEKKGGMAKGAAPLSVLIFDLGGGTFDVTLLKIENGVFEVKATSGNTHLGGEDFDDALVEHFSEELKKKHKKDIAGNARALRRLRSACERAKRMLSSATEATVEIDSLVDGVDFVSSINRARFERINQKLFQECLAPVETVLKDSGMSKAEVDEIVLVGGSTRIPKIQAMLQEFFDGKEASKSINPDEAVAYGAAVQGSILVGTSGESTKDLLLLDVTPLSLGVETEGKVMSTIIKRNSTIPCTKTDTYTTVEDNQPEITFKIYEGERPRSTDNHLLGEFELTGILPAKRGVPQIRVSMSINADGILSVQAKDEATGRSNSIEIRNNRGRLSADEIDRMLAEAEKFNKDDERIRLAQAARAELENYCHEATEGVAQLNGVADPDDMDAVDEKVAQIKAWLDDRAAKNAERAPEEYGRMKKELEAIYTPVINAAYAKTGGAKDRKRRGRGQK